MIPHAMWHDKKSKERNKLEVKKKKVNWNKNENMALFQLRETWLWF